MLRETEVAPLAELADLRDERLRALDEIDTTERMLHDSIIPAGAVADVLLDLWSTVHDVDHAAAVPLEELMTTLVRRSYTTPTELVPLFASTRMLLMSNTALTAHDDCRH
jgi:hypothetical protein